MAEYRFCLADSHNVIIDAPVLECESDAAASFAALEMIGEHAAVEVWDRTRLVTRLRKQSSEPAPMKVERSERPNSADAAVPMAGKGGRAETSLPHGAILSRERPPAPPAVDALEAALRKALRLMDEHYFALVCGLRRDGITLNVAGAWQAAPDRFENGAPVDPESDPRIGFADDVRSARRAAKKALARIRSRAA